MLGFEVSLIVAVVLLVAAFWWIIRARKKEARHLDDIHITGNNQKK